MSDNYVQSCVAVKLNSREDAVKALRLYQQAELYIENFDADDEDDNGEIEGAGYAEWHEFLNIVTDYENIWFKCELKRDELYIGGKEHVDPEKMALFIRFIQKRFDLNEPVLITWAETCSKLQPDEFTGGACLVHKDLIEFRDSNYEWFIRSCNEHGIARSDI